jgi:hypothetical protein
MYNKHDDSNGIRNIAYTNIVPDWVMQAHDTITALVERTDEQTKELEKIQNKIADWFWGQNSCNPNQDGAVFAMNKVNKSLFYLSFDAPVKIFDLAA